MTIEEMAEEFEVMVASSIMCETKERKSKLPTMHAAFIYGANAVLREIEFLFKHCRDYQLYHLLDLKIKELKGVRNEND